MTWGDYIILDRICIGLIIACFILAIYAQLNVKSTYAKYSRLITKNEVSGYESARMILDRNGLYNVKIEKIHGHLNDHYDPRANVIRLSEDVYSGTSPASVGVAAHEAGHALQYAKGYIPVKIRTKIIPVTSFCSRWSMLLIFLGFLFLAFPFGYYMALVGVAFYSMAVIFQLITLPVEFNASNRAIKCLEGSNRFEDKEIKASRKVLKAAALTYVAALASSAVTLLRYLIIIFGSRRRND